MIQTALALLLLGAATIETAPFASPEQEARYRTLIAELRCVKCQNQALADSDAPVAKDLRRIVREQLTAGASDDEIKRYLVARYGDFVLYDPPVKGSTWLLWFGPLLIVVLGGLLLIVSIRKQVVAGVESGEQ